jgi:hypothetical protein
MQSDSACCTFIAEAIPGDYTVMHSRERGKEIRSKRDRQIMRLLHSDRTGGVRKRQLREK